MDYTAFIDANYKQLKVRQLLNLEVSETRYTGRKICNRDNGSDLNS